jgi:hypothetical protein
MNSSSDEFQVEDNEDKHEHEKEEVILPPNHSFMS